MKVRKRDVVKALRAARRLALMTHDAAEVENNLRRHQWFEHQRAVQRQARRVEVLMADLGIAAELEEGE